MNSQVETKPTKHHKPLPNKHLQHKQKHRNRKSRTRSAVISCEFGLLTKVISRCCPHGNPPEFKAGSWFETTDGKPPFFSPRLDMPRRYQYGFGLEASFALRPQIACRLPVSDPLATYLISHSWSPAGTVRLRTRAASTFLGTHKWSFPCAACCCCWSAF